MYYCGFIASTDVKQPMIIRDFSNFQEVSLIGRLLNTTVNSDLRFHLLEVKRFGSCGRFFIYIFSAAILVK